METQFLLPGVEAMPSRDPYYRYCEGILRGDDAALHELLTREGGRLLVIMWREIEGYAPYEEVKTLLTRLTLRLKFQTWKYDPNGPLTFSQWIHQQAEQLAQEWLSDRQN
jgi:hypothetical protein